MVQAICDCESQSDDDELYAKPVEYPEYWDVPVIMLRDGTVTNRFADGVVGVPEKMAEAVKNDEEPYCPECESYIQGWEHE